jgi:hypothetical protein
MYKILVTATLLWLSGNALACDICGCSASGNYFGILPKFQQNFAGVRYQYRSFESKVHESISENGQASKEYFQTTELWGRYVPNKRLQMFAFVPFNINKRVEDTKTTVVSSLGDITVIANFVIINSDSSCKRYKHLLQIGGGVKSPTGKHEIIRNGIMLNQNIQPGTGSFDFPINAIYTMRHKQTGFNTEMGYTFNSPNNQHFQFGNRFSTAARIFYWKKLKQTILLPNIGVAFEKTQNDRISSIKQDYTGGEIVLANAGFDMYYKNISLGITYKKPVTESIGGGYISNRQRLSANFIYLF